MGLVEEECIEGLLAHITIVDDLLGWLEGQSEQQGGKHVDVLEEEILNDILLS